MKIADLILSQLDAETAPTRRVLERVPEGRNDWKPHEKSMPLGSLATLVASMPAWVAMMIEQEELDLNPPGGSTYRPQQLKTSNELVAALDANVAKARQALSKTTDDHLMKTWRLLVAGKAVAEDPRYRAILSTFGHLAHHRGQLSVYLRLNNIAVPSIYGPSADEGWSQQKSVA
jgi:uncharacterized damage-inducible protein DinB